MILFLLTVEKQQIFVCQASPFQKSMNRISMETMLKALL